MPTFGSAPRSAPYPTAMYPASAFFGATALQPATGNTTAENTTTPQDKTHMVIVIAVLVFGGYLAWHFGSK